MEMWLFVKGTLADSGEMPEVQIPSIPCLDHLRAQQQIQHKIKNEDRKQTYVSWQNIADYYLSKVGC